MLKALALILTPVLEPQLSRRCYHLKGHGGAKAAVREVAAQLPSHQFVFRTDVESYYASIDHESALPTPGAAHPREAGAPIALALSAPHGL